MLQPKVTTLPHPTPSSLQELSNPFALRGKITCSVPSSLADPKKKKKNTPLRCNKLTVTPFIPGKGWADVPGKGWAEEVEVCHRFPWGSPIQKKTKNCGRPDLASKFWWAQAKVAYSGAYVPLKSFLFDIPTVWRGALVVKCLGVNTLKSEWNKQVKGLVLLHSEHMINSHPHGLCKPGSLWCTVQNTSSILPCTQPRGKINNFTADHIWKWVLQAWSL